jgi:hypothetical protein
VDTGRTNSRFLALVPILALIALLSAPCRSAWADVLAARPADAVVDSVGVNTHLHYHGTSYNTLFETVVKPKLLATGVRHVRDGAYTYDAAGAQSAYYQRCRALAAAGIRFDLLTTFRTAATPVPTDYSRLADVYQWCDGAVESFEGVNEPDVQALPTDTPNWQTQTVESQQRLYAAVKGNPVTQHVDVLGPAIVWSPALVGDLSTSMDYGNWHPYPGGKCPTCSDVYGQSIDTFLPRYRQPSGTKPMVLTETGYHNAVGAPDGDHRAVTEMAAGKYIPRLLLENFNRGFRRSYLYELMDLHPDPSERDANFGLLRNDGREKPAYRALVSLLSLLRDPGPSFTTDSLDYTLSGETSRVHRTLLQKRDGTFLLALWLERSSYDTGARANAPDDLAARGDLTVPEQSVTLSLAAASGPLSVHRFGTDGRRSSTGAELERGRVALSLSDRMSVIEIAPSPSPSPMPSPEPAEGTDAPLESGPSFTLARIGEPPVANLAPSLGGLRARSVRRAGAPGISLVFTLSEPATVAVVIERVAGGRSGGRRVASLRVKGRVSRQTISLPARRIRRLRAGRYRVRVYAVDGLGARSPERSAHLQIHRR